MKQLKQQLNSLVLQGIDIQELKTKILNDGVGYDSQSMEFAFDELLWELTNSCYQKSDELRDEALNTSNHDTMIEARVVNKFAQGLDPLRQPKNKKKSPLVDKQEEVRK